MVRIIKDTRNVEYQDMEKSNQPCPLFGVIPISTRNLGKLKIKPGEPGSRERIEKYRRMAELELPLE